MVLHVSENTIRQAFSARVCGRSVCLYFVVDMAGMIVYNYAWHTHKVIFMRAGCDNITFCVYTAEMDRIQAERCDDSYV